MRIPQKINICIADGEGVVSIEYLRFEKKPEIFTRSTRKGFMVISKSAINFSPKYGIRAKIELIKPKKLIIPINGTTQRFANRLHGVKVLK